MLRNENLTQLSKINALLISSIDREPVNVELGDVMLRTDVKTTVGPFYCLPEYKTKYPQSITQALHMLYAEYNRAFKPLVDSNREWKTDYQFAIDTNGIPINRWVQIDMVGLPDNFLKEAAYTNPEEVAEALRTNTFEYENSIAMYQLLERLFSSKDKNSNFDTNFKGSLEQLRVTHGMPIALLAVTDKKYQAMKESEFGILGDGVVPASEVKRLSGFDYFFGPQEFREYIEQNRGKCGHLLFARTSDPLSKLRNPKTYVENPLLEDENMRRIIKAHAITFNIDNPEWVTGDERIINDSKAYMPSMGMAFPIANEEDLFSPRLVEHLANGGAFENFAEDDILSTDFVNFLRRQGIDPELVASGKLLLHAKPTQASYGGYGHHHAEIGNRKFRSDIRKGLRDRGPYVIQRKMKTPVVINRNNGQAYTYIDRNFCTNTGSEFKFMGGFRSLMPLDTQEAQRGRVHGNNHTVWAEIY